MTEAAIFAGTGNPGLARAVADHLGLRLADSTTARYPDGEVQVVLRESARGRTVVIVQPTSPPVDEHLAELLAFVDAARRSAAARIVAVVPYFGYARSDRRRARRGPIMASLVARLLEAAGMDHLVTVDLHSAQVEGFFEHPVDALTAVRVLHSQLAGRLEPDTVVVSPDLGRVGMAAVVAESLGLSTSVLGLVGDVRGRPCLIVDDILATGGTIIRAIDTLRHSGGRPSTHVAVVHALLLSDAADRLAKAGVREIVTTDTVPVPNFEEPRIRVGSVAPLVGSALARVLDV